MTIYAAVLYLHVLATLLLFSVLSIEVWVLHRLRRACSLVEACPWMNPAPGLRIGAIGSLLFLFLSGGYLAEKISAWNSAWPQLTVAAIVLFGALGAISSSRLRAIQTVNTYAALSEQLRDPTLKISLGIRLGLALGVILLMTAKPGMLQSLLILGTGILLGLATTLLPWGKPAVLARSPAQGD